MRLLAIPLVAAAFAFPAPASAHDVPCYGAYAGDANVGVCAGVICNDICVIEVVVHGQCSGVTGHAALVRACALVDNARVGA